MIAPEPSSPSGPPSATDWAAISVAAVSEMTRHALGAVRQAGGDEIRHPHAATRGGGGGGDRHEKDQTDADRDDADGDDVIPDDGDVRPL